MTVMLKTKKLIVPVLCILAFITFTIQYNSYENSKSFKVKEPETILFKRQSTDALIPTIYVITPTYYRWTQLADMTRLSNTLRHIPKIHWIVIEEGNTTRDAVEDLLLNSDVSYTYMHAARYTQVSSRLKGIHQRNLGLHWIRHHVNHNVTDGVFFFADDDNSYDRRLFEEMRYTKKISVWPVGFVSRMKYQRPVVENGKVVKIESWNSEYRTFPLDMAGFALNINVLFENPYLYFLMDFHIGYQETQFLEICCEFKELEPKAKNCTQVLVWHTRTEEPTIELGNGIDLTV